MNQNRPPMLIFFARSFGKHALELGNEIPKKPIYFLKAPSSMIKSGQAIILPKHSDEIHHEAEVAFYLKKDLSHATINDAEEAIGDWTILNDVTARDVQRADSGRFTQCKNFDTFCPISTQRVKQLDWRKSRIQCVVNGKLRQDAPLTDLLFSPAELLVYLSERMSLRTGDLVSLGTPAGVGPLEHGDVCEIRLFSDQQLLIKMTNPVIRPANSL